MSHFDKHHAPPHYHGFCPECCHPAHACCCHEPHCRKESKELVVEPKAGTKDARTDTIHRMALSMVSMRSDFAAAPPAATGAAADNQVRLLRTNTLAAAAIEKLSVGTASAFIGGGCCVHLSIEYMPDELTNEEDGIVLVMVTDSTGTILAWGKYVEARTPYAIKENIITTNPGAKLLVYSVNMMARVRWCEVFSC